MIDVKQVLWRKDIAVEEKNDQVIIYVDSVSAVSDSEGTGTGTASKGYESNDTADEFTLCLLSGFLIRKFEIMLEN